MKEQPTAPDPGLTRGRCSPSVCRRGRERPYVVPACVGRLGSERSPVGDSHGRDRMPPPGRCPQGQGTHSALCSHSSECGGLRPASDPWGGWLPPLPSPRHCLSGCLCTRSSSSLRVPCGQRLGRIHLGPPRPARGLGHSRHRSVIPELKH